MKSKITKGNGFRGALEYLYGPGEENHPGRPVPVEGAGNVLGTEPRDLARQFAASRRLRPGIKNPVFHVSLSCPPGEKPGDAKWAEIARDYLSRMGMDPDRHQWHCLRHIDQEHDHIHLLVCRIALDGKVWHDQYGIRQSIRICLELEKAHNLKVTPGEEGGEKKSLSKGELGQYRRTGQIPDRLVLQTKITAARENCPDFRTFVSRCQAEKIEIIPNGKSGQVGGISFRRAGGDAFSGSSLGKAFKWQRIAADTHFDQARDAELIAQLRAKAADSEVAGTFSPAGPVPTAAPDIQRARGQIDPRKERDRYFIQQEDGSWAYRKKPERTAFRLEGQQIHVLARQDLAIRAALLTASETFGQSLKIQGEEEFCRKAWLAGSKMGLDIKGYQPSAEDLAELQSWREKHGMPDSIGPAASPQNQIQPGYTLPPKEETAHEHDSENGGGDRTSEQLAAGNAAPSPAPDGGAGGRDLAADAGTAAAGDAGDSGHVETTVPLASADQGAGTADPAPESANCDPGAGVRRNGQGTLEAPAAASEEASTEGIDVFASSAASRPREEQKMISTENQEVTPKHIMPVEQTPEDKAREWIEKIARKRSLTPVQFGAIAHTDVGYKLHDLAPEAIRTQVREQLRDLYNEHRKEMHKEINQQWGWRLDPEACHARCLKEKHGERRAELAKEKKQALNRQASLKRQVAEAEKQQEMLAFWQFGQREKVGQDIVRLKELGGKEARRLEKIEQEIKALKVTPSEIEAFAEKAERQEKVEHQQLDKNIDNQIRRADPEVRLQEREAKEKALAEQQERERQEREAEERRVQEEARAEEERLREAEERREAGRAKKANSAPRPT
ncbi:relaxase/mobilization nuclease domain-containing protein [Thiovibrio sp. JS02]